jgi:uncharacterized protein YjbI with pentapeptide repeats
MIKFDVFNCFTASVQFTAEIDAEKSVPASIKLGLAIRWAHHNGASLVGANLIGARLDRASLDGANLDSARLDRASLVGANLDGASLVGARLDGARLGNQWIVQGATRSDGYAFFLQKLTADEEPMIKAGCRYFTLAQAKAHWTNTRRGTALGQETEIIIRSMVALACARGLIVAN